MCVPAQKPSYNRAHTYSLKQKFTHNGPLLPMNRLKYTLTLSHLCSCAKMLKQKNPNNKYTKKLPPIHLECSASCSGISLPFIHGSEFQISSRELMRFQINNLNVCWHVSEIFITLVGANVWAFLVRKCFEHFLVYLLFGFFCLSIFAREHKCDNVSVYLSLFISKSSPLWVNFCFSEYVCARLYEGICDHEYTC